MNKHESGSEKRNTIQNFVILLFLISALFSCSDNQGKGWRTYRHDGFRSAATDENLPQHLSPNWVFKSLHRPNTAWHKPGEELPRMHSDNTYPVVSTDGIVYFATSVDDKLYALNADDGTVEWSFIADGPIRFAPTLWKNRIFFGSDDGHVYCLNKNTGNLIWKYHAGPSAKKVIGNGRMISLWPVRTSVLVEDGVVYFGAGVFPYEGIYICALAAKDGSVIWKNDTTGDEAHELQFGGISPHGYLLASEDILYVPSGRSMPAAFERKSGKFLYALSPGSKAGGSWGLIDQNKLIAGVERSGTPAKISYDIETGQRKGDAFIFVDGIDMVASGNITYVLTTDGISAIERDKYPRIENKIDSLMKELADTNNLLRKAAQSNLENGTESNKEFDQLIGKIKSLQLEKKNIQASATRWHHPQADLANLILAGDKLISGGKGGIFILGKDNGEELHRFDIEGTALCLASADNYLFASNDKGYIYCFSEAPNQPLKEIESDISTSPFADDNLTMVYQAAAGQILRETGITKGYCLVMDSREGRLAYELARQSDLMVIGIEQDEEKVKKARKSLAKTALYGTRIVIENWSVENLPAYFADLIVSDDYLVSSEIHAAPGQIHRILKPFGGMICLGRPAMTSQKSDTTTQTALLNWMRQIGAEEPLVSLDQGFWLKTKRGTLKGAGGWTHQYANPANTICSDDQLVNYPFGVLWYGEPGPEKMIERHARAAAPLAKNGRLFIQGENVIMAYDAYNGVKLWEKQIPGANRVRVDVDGSNLSLSDEGLFVAAGADCFLLDAATGETRQTYRIPAAADGKPRRWGTVFSSAGTLFGSAAKPYQQEYNHLLRSLASGDTRSQTGKDVLPAYFASQFPSFETAEMDFQRSGAKWHFIADYPAWDGGIVTQEPVTEKVMYSDAVFAFDIHTAKLKWLHRGKKIAHITISIGDGYVCIADNGITPSQKKQGIAERRRYAQNAVWKEYIHPPGEKEIDVRLVSVLDAESGKVRWQRPVDLSGCGGDALASAYKNNTLLFFGSFGLHDKWRFEANELRWHRITALSAENGKMLWSRPLNYMVRPVVIGDTIIVEPRACDLHTGAIITRIHPVTGRTVPWEYFRPGHTCAITSASSSCLFYRSYNTAFYDLAADRGITYFGAIRPGCWINMIPANGLLLFPEASAGCTCSFPLRTTVALKPEPQTEAGDWSVYVSQGPITPVQRLGINLGAPGDKKDENGDLWFGYPRPVTGYGVRFSLNEIIEENLGYFSYDTRGVQIKGTDKPWLFTSGCVGLSLCRITLIDNAWSVKPEKYTVRLGFFSLSPDRVFDIRLQNKTVVENFDPGIEVDVNNQVAIREFKHIDVEDDLLIELIPDDPSADTEQAPVLNFIEIIREDGPAVTDVQPATASLSADESGRYLAIAGREADKGNKEEALTFYHRVFAGGSSTERKKQALAGMAGIGSVKSLGVIENYIRQTSPLFWDFNEPDPAFIDQVLRVYVAVANKLAASNPQKAKIMLTTAVERASDIELKENILTELIDLGLDVKTTSAIPGSIKPGIRYEYYEGNFTTVDGLDQAKPKHTGTMTGFNLQQPEGVMEYGYLFSGYVSVPDDGIYTFFIESNDGSKLYIDGKELVNNDGGHGAKEESGKISLRKGYYPLIVKYFQMGSGQTLKVSWESSGFKKRVMTADDVVYVHD